MSLGVTEEHVELATMVGRLAAAHGMAAESRAVVDKEACNDAASAALAVCAENGLTGLHIAEQHGGSGYGLLEAAVAIEQLGYALTPGPLLASVVTSAVLARAGSTEHLERLATGTTRGATGWGVGGLGLTAERESGDIIITGTTGPVLGAPTADMLVLRAASSTGEVWFAVGAADVEVTPLTPLDATRSLGTVTLDRRRITEQQLLEVASSDVVAIGDSLACAELAGVAAWCLDTAVAYAKVREQFGKTIGHFQAIKHKCADMLVLVEQARACAWDAARAAGDGDDTATLAAAVAVEIAAEAAVVVAKECIQILGGIGYTWEHDAHLYLKRAAAMRALVVGGRHPASEVAELALDGQRRELSVELPEELAGPVRAEVEAFLTSIEGLGDDEQRRATVDAGWFLPHWPAPWGRDAGPLEQLVIDQAFRDAKVTRADLVIGGWAVATIVQHGTDEHRERFARPTLYGDITWCQMFSEPGAGSDLAALSTKAVMVDGGWELTGQKVWTSMAQTADWAICLARTDVDAPKHAGITYFLIDMSSEGLDVRPLIEITGKPAFNEIFLDKVFVPDDQVVGGVNAGWRIARATLNNERVAMASGSSMGPGVEGVLRAAAHTPAAGDPRSRDRIGALVCEGQSLSLLGFRTTLKQLAGIESRASASVKKLIGMSHAQDCSEFTLELLGPTGAATDSPAGMASEIFLRTRALSIAGGTTEVQRNIVAERILGLPRDT